MGRVRGKPHGTRSAKVRRLPGGGGYCAHGHLGLWLRGLSVLTVRRWWTSELAREGRVSTYRDVP